MAARNEVNIVIKAKDMASAKISGIAGKMGGALRLGAIAGAVAVAGLGVAAVKMAADFEKGFAEVTTLFDGSKKQVDALRVGVIDMAAEMGVNAVDATEALYNAISAGVDPDNAVAFLKENAKFAIAGVTDLNTAVDLTTTVMNAWGMEAEELGRVQDVLFSTVRAGKTTVAELGASMFQVAPAASAAGVSLEGVGAALATLTAQGVPTTVAATSLRAALVELGKGGTKANKAFTEIAGEGFRDFIAGGGDMVGAMEIMQQAADAQGVAISDLFGAVEGGLAVQVLAGEGFDALRANMDAALASSGLTQEAFEKMNETFGRQFGILKNQLSIILMEVGLRILPVLTSAIQSVLGPLREFADVTGNLLTLAIQVLTRDLVGYGETFKKLPDSIQPFATKLISVMRIIRDDVIPAVQALAEHFTTGMQTILEAVRPMFEFISDNKPIMIAALIAIGVAVVIAFGPASVAIVAIAGLITAIGWLSEDWEELAGVFEDFLPVFAGTGAAIAVVAVAIMGTLIPAIVAWTVAEIAKTTAMIAAGAAFLLANAPIIAIVAGVALLVAGIVLLIQHWDDVVDITKTVIDWMAEHRTVLLLLLGPLGLLIDVIVRVVQNWDDIIAKISEVIDAFTGVATTIAEVFGGLPGEFLQLGIDVVVGLWDGIASMQGWIIDKVKGIAGDILGAMKSGLGKLMPFSPSELGIEIGEGLIDGIAVGVADSMGKLRQVGRSLQTELERLLGLQTVEGAQISLELADLNLREFNLLEPAGADAAARAQRILDIEEAFAARREEILATIGNVAARADQVREKAAVQVGLQEEELAEQRIGMLAEIEAIEDTLETNRRARRDEILLMEDEARNAEGDTRDAIRERIRELRQAGVVEREEAVDRIAGIRDRFAAERLAAEERIELIKSNADIELLLLEEKKTALEEMMETERGIHEEKIEMIGDHRTAVELELIAVRDTITAIGEMETKRRLENDVIAAQGALLDETLPTMVDVNTATQTWMETIKDVSAALVLFGGDIQTSLTPALGGLRQSIFDAIAPMIAAGIALGTLPGSAMLDFLRSLPAIHQGGIVPGLPGQNVPMILQAGEQIIPADQAGVGGGITQNFYLKYESPAAIANAVEMAMLRAGQRIALAGV